MRLRKYLVLFLLLIAVPASPWSLVGTTGTGGGGLGGGGDSCTGNLILSWHMEAEDVTSGTPAGCTRNADTSFALSGTASLSMTQVSDGTYSIKRTDNTALATIPIADASASQGYVSFDLYMPTGSFGSGDITLVRLDYGADDYVRIYLTSSKYIVAAYYSTSGTDRTISTSGTPLTDQWTSVMVYWRTTVSPYMFVSATGQTSGSQSNAITAMAGVPTSISMLGSTNNTYTIYLDKLSIRNVYNP